MRESACRRAYRFLLALHPKAFQEEFAADMMWIFDENPRGTAKPPSLRMRWYRSGGNGCFAEPNLLPLRIPYPRPWANGLRGNTSAYQTRDCRTCGSCKAAP